MGVFYFKNSIDSVNPADFESIKILVQFPGNFCGLPIYGFAYAKVMESILDFKSLWAISVRIQAVKLKIPGKTRITNFCYIQVIVFDIGYLPVAAVGT